MHPICFERRTCEDSSRTTPGRWDYMSHIWLSPGCRVPQMSSTDREFDNGKIQWCGEMIIHFKQFSQK